MTKIDHLGLRKNLHWHFDEKVSKCKIGCKHEINRSDGNILGFLKKKEKKKGNDEMEKGLLFCQNPGLH